MKIKGVRFFDEYLDCLRGPQQAMWKRQLRARRQKIGASLQYSLFDLRQQGKYVQQCLVDELRAVVDQVENHPDRQTHSLFFWCCQPYPSEAEWQAHQTFVVQLQCRSGDVLPSELVDDRLSYPELDYFSTLRMPEPLNCESEVETVE